MRLKSDKDVTTAVDMFKMVMRFMGDVGLTGIKEHILGNYIIHKVHYEGQCQLNNDRQWFRVYPVLILRKNYLPNCVTKHGVMKMGRALRKDGF